MSALLRFIICVFICLPGCTGSLLETEEFSASKVVKEIMNRSGIAEAQAYFTLGRVFSEDKKWKLAEQCYLKSVELDESLYMAWYDLGLMYVSEEKGVEYFKKAIGANSDYAPSYYWIAYQSVRIGKDERAIEYFEKYLNVAEEQGEEIERARMNMAKKALDDLKGVGGGETLKKIRGRI